MVRSQSGIEAVGGWFALSCFVFRRFLAAPFLKLLILVVFFCILFKWHMMAVFFSLHFFAFSFVLPRFLLPFLFAVVRLVFSVGVLWPVPHMFFRAFCRRLKLRRFGFFVKPAKETETKTPQVYPGFAFWVIFGHFWPS